MIKLKETIEMNVDKVLDIGFNSVVTIEEKTKS